MHADFQRKARKGQGRIRGAADPLGFPAHRTAYHEGHQMHEREPTPHAIDAMRDHCRSAHDDTDLDLHRDVTFVGNIPADAKLIYLAETPTAPARFECPRCPGLLLAADEPTYGHPERNSLLLVAYPELGRTLLHGVSDPAERAMLLEDWDRGRLGKLQVNAARTRRSMRTKKAERPSVDDRRRRCQEYLLARVREGAIVGDAIAALDALSTEDPPAYARLMCGPDILKPETLRKYWGGIPIAVRNAARAAGAAKKSTP